MDARTSLDWAVTSPSCARRFLRQVLADCCDGRTVDAAELMVSELVTNAVVHGGTAVDVTVVGGPHAVRVEVSDRGRSTFDPSTVLSSSTAEGGRGLAIVAACAARWGTRRREPGTTVWFELLPNESANVS